MMRPGDKVGYLHRDTFRNMHFDSVSRGVTTTKEHTMDREDLLLWSCAAIPRGVLDPWRAV